MRTQGGVVWIPLRRLRRAPRQRPAASLRSALRANFARSMSPRRRYSLGIIGVELDGRLERLRGLLEIVARRGPRFALACQRAKKASASFSVGSELKGSRRAAAAKSAIARSASPSTRSAWSPEASSARAIEDGELAVSRQQTNSTIAPNCRRPEPTLASSARPRRREASRTATQPARETIARRPASRFRRHPTSARSIPAPLRQEPRRKAGPMTI